MKIDNILEAKGLRPTSNRVLVLRAIIDAGHPVSLNDIDEAVATMYKSTIFRVLGQFADHDVVHTIDDGSGSLKYELCSSHDHCSIEDMHVHFFCEKCQRTFCLESTHIPKVQLPDGFAMHSANYVIKGVCPECN